MHSAKTYDVNIKLQREGENKKQIPNWELFSIFCPSGRERGGLKSEATSLHGNDNEDGFTILFQYYPKAKLSNDIYFQYYEQDVLDYERYWDGRY